MDFYTAEAYGGVQSATPATHMPDSRDLVRRLTADLQRASGALDTLINVLPVGIGVAEDRECRRIRINRAFAEQLGLTVEQNASLSAPEGERPRFKVLIDGVEVDSDDLPIQCAARTGAEVGPIECEIVRPDGRRLTLYEFAAPLFDEDGSVRGAIGVSMDITERLRSEQEQRFLAGASEILSSSLEYEHTLRALAKLAVPFMGEYCTVDVLREDGSFGRVEFVVDDPALQDIAEGMKRYPPRLERHDSPSARVLRSGEPHLQRQCTADILDLEAQNAEHHGLLTALGMNGFIMAPLTARGRTLGLLSVGLRRTSRRAYTDRDLQLAIDIARRAGLALENALLYQQAQEANRLKEEFLATLSHELRTPLNALLGWTQMLKVRAADDAFRLRALESIERSARAQGVLINDLLDVSRVVSGKLKLESQPLDLQSVLLAAVDAVRPAVRARDIELDVSAAPIRNQVIGDADRLQQVIWNLLSNAVKFTPPGGRIEVTVAQSGGAVQITVADTGGGIDPAFLPHVFERFRQADSGTTRVQGGLGLGLAIVRHLVELHGGTVTVESEGLGRGSLFVVTLPTKQGPAPAARDARPAADQLPANVLQGVRVIAVDDDADSRELLLVIMQDAGAEVMAVGSAHAALEALDSFNPHVAIVDIAMPEVDGYDLMRQIGRRADAPPAIAFSAYVGSDALQRSREVGFAMHLAKPTDYRRLVKAVAELAGAVESCR